MLWLTRRGSPPRMRGKGERRKAAWETSRITPAYAGKSTHQPPSGRGTRGHPHVCGEMPTAPYNVGDLCGSPPRVRGKVSKFFQVQSANGITPACAGKSAPERLKTASARGSPPRVRGKASLFAVSSSLSGITPACAGKRRPAPLRANLARDHPRVCGEKLDNPKFVYSQ